MKPDTNWDVYRRRSQRHDSSREPDTNRTRAGYEPGHEPDRNRTGTRHEPDTNPDMWWYLVSFNKHSTKPPPKPTEFHFCENIPLKHQGYQSLEHFHTARFSKATKTLGFQYRESKKRSRHKNFQILITRDNDVCKRLSQWNVEKDHVAGGCAQHHGRNQHDTVLLENFPLSEFRIYIYTYIHTYS